MRLSHTVERLRAVCGDALRLGEPLAPHVSFGIGGPADYFVAADSVALAVDALAVARELELPWLVLGRGSNVLVSDRGVRGLVVRLQAGGFAIDDEAATLHAEGGARLASLATATATRGLAGLEWAVGIPGSVGGAVAMNAGAHGGCIADCLAAALVLTADGTTVTLPASELEFVYRGSRFHPPAQTLSQARPSRREIVLAADFRLRRESADAVLGRLRAHRKHRQDTQPTDPGAGSIFRNPPGNAAGRLIDQVGLKGTARGGALVSPKHGNFLVNSGSATASDVVALIRQVRSAVEAQTGVRLELEVELVGEWLPEERP